MAAQEPAGQDSAAMGTGEGKRALETVGLSIEDIMAQDPAERFKMVAEAIRGLDDQSKKASAAADLLGRSGMRLLDTLEMGRDGLNVMVDEADKLGLSFSRTRPRTRRAWSKKSGRSRPGDGRAVG